MKTKGNYRKKKLQDERSVNLYRIRGRESLEKNLRRICFDQLYEPCENDEKVRFSKSPICSKEKSH